MIAALHDPVLFTMPAWAFLLIFTVVVGFAAYVIADVVVDWLRDRSERDREDR